MKKANEIWKLFGAKVALLIEKDGVLYVYQSHDSFPDNLPGIALASNKKTPKNFTTLAEQEEKETHERSPSPPTSEMLLSATGVKAQTDGRIAAKQPVYRVVKRRKIQGRAYFTGPEPKEETD